MSGNILNDFLIVYITKVVVFLQNKFAFRRLFKPVETSTQWFSKSNFETAGNASETFPVALCRM